MVTEYSHLLFTVQIIVTSCIVLRALRNLIVDCTDLLRVLVNIVIL